MKKIFYSILLSLFFVMMKGVKVNAEAIGTCILQQTDKKYEVEVPFYWYTVTRSIKTGYASLPMVAYDYSTNYINSKEQCLAIDGAAPSIRQEDTNTHYTTTYNFSNTNQTNAEQLFISSLFQSIDETFQKDLTIHSEYLSLDDRPPIIATESINPLIIVQVEHTLNISMLKNKVTAYDEVDGVVKVEIHEDNYSKNHKTLGEYPVIFSATDESENTAYLTITIKVVDTTKPTITGQKNLKSYMSNPLTIDEIKETMTLQDNYYSLSIENLKLIEDNYSNSLEKEGTFNISFKAIDPSNNSSELFIINIEMYDDIIPTIEGETSYEISNKILLDLEKIKSQLIARDNIDNNPYIEITDNLYSNNYYKTGIYQVTFIAKDKNSNTSIPHTININVKDITKPTFYISQKFIGIDGSSNVTLEQLIDIIEETNNISSTDLLNCTIVKDEYSKNKNTPGTYLIELNYEYKDKENINIQTHIIVDDYISNKTPQKNSTPKKDFWSTIKQFFLKIWNFIKYIFSFKWFKLD